MASLSTCHLEFVVWDGNLVNSTVIVIIIMVHDYIYATTLIILRRNIKYILSLILHVLFFHNVIFIHSLYNVVNCTGSGATQHDIIMNAHVTDLCDR